MTKRLYQDKTAEHVDAFLACTLILLEKQSGIRPIGIGEVLTFIIGKIALRLLKIDVSNTTGSLQLCTGQGRGSEAAVHAVYKMFNEEDAERVLMVNPSNAFNSIVKLSFIIQKLSVHFYQHILTTPSDHQQILISNVAGRKKQKKETPKFTLLQ